MKIGIFLSLTVAATLSLPLPLMAAIKFGNSACEKVLVFWQAINPKILNNDEYAQQKTNELTARLGRAQEFIARKKVDPKYLRLEKRFPLGNDQRQTEMILGYLGERRVLIKIFWQASGNLDSEIGGAIIQDFLSEMEISPKIYGLIVDADKIRDLKAVRSLPFMVDRNVRSKMYLALVMEYVPNSFNIPNGRFMPAWYTALNKDEVNEQITKLEQVLLRLGIKRQPDSEFLVTDTQRIYAVDFTTEDFNPNLDQQELSPAESHAPVE
jgi:hypothetical protein